MRPRFDDVWRALDAQVDAGELPGYAGAVRIRGELEIRAGGRQALDQGGAPMRAETLFRIASATKQIGGALTLSLVEDGLIALDDPIARSLQEAAKPRVLDAPNAPLDRARAAERAIMVRQLLNGTCRTGAVMEQTPLQAATMERGVYPGPLTPAISGDEFVARVAALALGPAFDGVRPRALLLRARGRRRAGADEAVGRADDRRRARAGAAGAGARDRRPRRLVGPRDRGRRRASRARDGAWTRGLGRRHGNERARRPDARHRCGAGDTARDDRPTDRPYAFSAAVAASADHM